MANPPRSNEFLSLAPRTFLPGEDSSPILPHLDTLFAEFARSRPRISPPQSPNSSVSQRRHRASELRRSIIFTGKKLELRALDYVSDYDSNLMCPICHVPFVDPVVLDCDHTFCASCFDECRNGSPGTDRSKCPSCRSYLFGVPRKASRLIKNMCNEVRVQCPNDDCETVMARGCVEQHATKDCPEEQLSCPSTECDKQTKRKNFVPHQCVHSSQVNCECGAVIELGRGDWLQHRDKDCPKTGMECRTCGERLTTRTFLAGEEVHVCPVGAPEGQTCPGAEFGCMKAAMGQGELKDHVQSCPLARVAPHLQKQTLLIQSLQEQLAMTKLRNEALETSHDRMNDVLTNQVQTRISHLPIIDPDVEEIERDHIPGITGHRTLLLPAHVRELTPSPDVDRERDRDLVNSHSFQQLLAMYESLRTSTTILENDMNTFSNTLAEVDGRHSMQLMNETLRIKEELAHTNAALFSTRSQVQWMLNRERLASQQQAVNMTPFVRGRQTQQDQRQHETRATTQPFAAPSSSQTASTSTPSQASRQGRTTAPSTTITTDSTGNARRASSVNHARSSLAPGTGTEAGLGSSRSAGPSPSLPAMDHPEVSSTSAGTSTSTSPTFGSARPSMRRSSGGSSQERVKL